VKGEEPNVSSDDEQTRYLSRVKRYEGNLCNEKYIHPTEMNCYRL